MSKCCGSSKAPLQTINGLSLLLEFLCIVLATNSLPDQEGPEIKTLQSDCDILLIVFLISLITFEFPINS